MEKVKGIIRLTTEPKEWNGQLQIGFTLEVNPNKWYNISGTDEELTQAKEEVIKKGNEIEFNFDNGKISNLKVLAEGKEEEENRSDVVVNIKGKDFITYKGLLDKAHKEGLQSIELLNSWVSEDMSRAWCTVRARFIKDKKEMFFDGFGSSTPENTGEMTAKHPVEMCNTRSKARAFRDALNIGDAAIEELKEIK